MFNSMSCLLPFKNILKYVVALLNIDAQDAGELLLIKKSTSSFVLKDYLRKEKGKLLEGTGQSDSNLGTAVLSSTHGK